MKLLLLSDTHGHLDIINEYVHKTHPDFVIHAGDFGFYTPESIPRLRRGDLVNILRHDPNYRKMGAPVITKDVLRDDLNQMAMDCHAYGDFVDYYVGRKQFDAPVIAIHGNHSDPVILRNSLGKIHNLYILSLSGGYPLNGAYIFGLGGVLGRKGMLHQLAEPVPELHGQLWANFSQLARIATSLRVASIMPSILVSHASPDMEPILTAMANLGNVPFTVSGHMHYPHHKIWEATSEELEAGIKQIEEFRTLFPQLQWDLFIPDGPPKKITHINLMLAADGYVVVDFNVNGKLEVDWSISEIYERNESNV